MASRCISRSSCHRDGLLPRVGRDPERGERTDGALPTPIASTGLIYGTGSVVEWSGERHPLSDSVRPSSIEDVAGHFMTLHVTPHAVLSAP